MRTYGRITNPDGSLSWVEVSTDANGNNDKVWLTTLVQTLKLNLGESPFFATSGIPAQQSVMQQVFPDYYVSLTQQAFAPFFASLIISKVPNTTMPTYDVRVTTNQGVTLNASIPIPT
jgi:hypothetical protein